MPKVSCWNPSPSKKNFFLFQLIKNVIIFQIKSMGLIRQVHSWEKKPSLVRERGVGERTEKPDPRVGTITPKY